MTLMAGELLEESSSRHPLANHRENTADRIALTYSHETQTVVYSDSFLNMDLVPEAISQSQLQYKLLRSAYGRYTL